MGQIQVLSFEVANLIAAGEVVDRPASAIKEMMENAIDAGAKHITVEIQNGGVSLMRVTDDGCGMSAEDLPMAIRRHATSKIRDAEDLGGILTLGFRGEALAAISSVSDMRILTKRAEDDMGHVMEVRGGAILGVTEQGSRNGTTIIVENLFSTVPVRRKFLKRDATEASAVASVVERVALSHPEIAIRFISDGNTKIETVGDGSLKNTIWAVYGRDYATRMIPVDGHFDGIHVYGFVGRTDNVRGNRNGQCVFINHRYIRSLTAQSALEQAFVSYIPPDKRPTCVLHIDLNPAIVDVNVHPAKMEVKFSAEKPVFEAVYYAVRQALEQNIPRPEFAIPDKAPVTPGRVSDMTTPVEIERQPSLGRRQVRMDLAGGARTEAVTSYRAAPVVTSARQNGTPPVHMPPAQRSATPVVTAPPSSPASRAATDIPLIAETAEREAPVLTSADIHITAEDYVFYYRYRRRKRGDRPQMSASFPRGRLPAPFLPPTGDPAIPAVHPDGRLPRRPKGPLTRVEASIFGGDASLTPPTLVPEAVPSEAVPSETTPIEKGEPVGVDCSPADMTSQTAAEVFAIPAADEFFPSVPEAPAHTATLAEPPEPYRMVGEVFHSYVIVERGDTMLLIDKHAAHERIIFEDLRARMREREVESQLLLLPLEVMLMSEEVGLLEAYRAELEAVGFTYDCLRNTVRVTSIPSGVDPGAVPDMIAAIVEGLGRDVEAARLARDIFFEKALYQAACKAAIKAGRDYPTEHIAWLVDKLMALPDITVCPHGRPVAMEMKKRTLDHRFERC